jgi:hypothetical protein
MAQHPKAAAHTRQQQQAAVARRSQVAQLRLGGWRDPEAIGQQLGVSGRTIRRDFAWLDTQWRAAATTDTATLKGRQLERIEDAITGIWNDVRQGHHAAVNALLGLLDREAKLMGLDAPKMLKVDIEERIRFFAQQYGLDPDETVAEAQRILDESAAVRGAGR